MSMDVVVAGGCVIDLISYADRFPVAGETLIGKKFSKGFGGKGANQCVMINKLGGKTAMIGKLGDDSFGHEYYQCFEINKINADHVTITKEGETSSATICVTSTGENSIIYVPGAILHLKKEDMQNAENLISNAKVFLCCYECPLESVLEGLTIAKKYGVYTIVNAAPAAPQPYEEVYALCDILCVNEVEVEAATGLKVETIDEAKKVSKVLLSKGCKTAIITLGANGVVFCSKEKPSPVHIPAKEVAAFDTTGAGDAFLGSLTYYVSIYPHLSMEEKIRRSCEIAAYSVLLPGTQISFPSKKDLPDSLFK